MCAWTLWVLEAYIDLWKGIQYRKSTKDYLTNRYHLCLKDSLAMNLQSWD